MMRCDPGKLFKKERGISYHFPVTHLADPTVFVTRNMMIGSVIRIKGVPFDTEKSEILNRYKRGWHQVLLGMGSEFSVLVSQHRHKQNVELSGAFNQQFLQEVDARYHKSIGQHDFFVNDIYLTILMRGLRLGKFTPIFDFLSILGRKSLNMNYNNKLQERLSQLKQVVQQVMISLSDFSPILLGCRDKKFKYSELLQFFSIFLSGGDLVKMQFPDFSGCLSSSLGQYSKQMTQYPFGHIAAYLANRRISFGEMIEFHPNGESQSKYAAMVSLKRYATQTISTMFDSMLKLDFEYLFTNSFLIEAKESAQRIIGRHRCKMESVNDAGFSQIDALSLVQDHLASDHIMMGYHHSTLMVFGDDQKNLEKSIAKGIKHFANAGFVAIRETIGQEPAYWSQIPGNIRMIARSALITSENFVDFCPLHNYRTGYKDQNHLGSAVTILTTPSKTPYFFNFHAKGNEDTPSKGHTTIIGGNGSGKTVAMAFFDAQLSRYGGRTFVFDRDHGLEIYLRACEGHYMILSPDYAAHIHFNPFRLPDTAVNRKFCRQWMAELIKEENEPVIPADLTRLLAQCVDYTYENLPPTERRLYNAALLLPVSFPRWPHLRRWLRADDRHPEGEYAYLFDNVEDDFCLHQKMGFDMTHFLDNEPRSVLSALIMYLFHQLERSFDGNLVTVLLDEGWQYLENHYWIVKLRKWLPTLRKLNCHLVLATQSPSSIVESPIRNMILDNVATQIFFSNPQAQRAHYREGFNLTESEFLAIKEADPLERSFLLKQEQESCLCKLDLSMMSDIIPIFSANRSSLLLQSKIRKQYGEDPQYWLSEFRRRIC